MSNSLEIEKTYLAKRFPVDLSSIKSKKIVDIYIPEEAIVPSIRLRQNGEKYEFTKKVQVDPNNASVHVEHTVPLSKSEFEYLGKSGKVVEKTRYYFDFENFPCELDVFSGELEGLVLVDFEFKDQESYKQFKMPGFCLVDVTQENFIAGKNLAGKKYEDLLSDLVRLGYSKVVSG